MACVAEPAHATSAESPGALGRQSNGSTTAEGPSSPGASGREARSPSNGSATAPATTTTATTTNTAGDSTAGAHGQLNKLKRFLATVQQFADDIAPDIGDRVRTLVLALVVSTQMSFVYQQHTVHHIIVVAFCAVIASKTPSADEQLIRISKQTRGCFN